MTETVDESHSEDESCNEDESDVVDVNESDDDVCAQSMEASCTFAMCLHATGEAPIPSPSDYMASVLNQWS